MPAALGSSVVLSQGQDTQPWLVARASLHSQNISWHFCALWANMIAKRATDMGIIRVWDSWWDQMFYIGGQVSIWWRAVLCNTVGFAASPCYDWHILSSGYVDMAQEKISSRNTKCIHRATKGMGTWEGQVKPVWGPYLALGGVWGSSNPQGDDVSSGVGDSADVEGVWHRVPVQYVIYKYILHPLDQHLIISCVEHTTLPQPSSPWSSQGWDKDMVKRFLHFLSIFDRRGLEVLQLCCWTPSFEPGVS